MLEAKIEKAELLKKILDAIKELVTDANWDCDESAMKLQAMDNSHIALVSLELKQECFESYRCDRNMSLGMNLNSFTKILKCAGNDDQVKITASDDTDVLGLQFQNRSKDRMGDYEMKLMDIDQEHLGIPDTAYDATVVMPSSEFLRIVRDIKELGESVKIEVTKEGIKFSSEGEIGSAAVTLRPTVASTRSAARAKSEDEDEEMEDAKPKIENGSDDEEGEKDDDEEDGDESPKKKATKTNGTKKARVADSDEEDQKPDITAISSDEAENEEAASDDEEGPKSKKRKADKSPKKSAKKKTGSTIAKGKSTTTKAKKGAKKTKDDEEDRAVSIHFSPG